MAPRSLWSALPLFLLLAPSLAVENDFSFYPSGARSCLYDAADAAGCTSGSISALNTCLCGNNNDFVINTAKCLGEKDSGDVDTVYDTMSSACSDSSTPLSVSKSDFQDAASGASSGTTTAADSSTTEAASSTQAASSDTATTTDSVAVVTQSAYTTTIGGSTVTVIPTQTHTSAAESSSSSSSSSNDNSSGLSTTATIGVGVGAAVAGAGIVGAIVFFVLRRRGRRDEEQAHPMLLQNQQGTPQNPSPFAPPPSVTPAMTFSSEAPSHSNWTGGTSPSPASAGWNTPAGVSPYSQYNTPGQAHLAPGVAPPMQQVQPQVFEMDSSQTVVVPPVEMPGSAVQR